MNDPKRIPEILDNIQRLWTTNPDMRLMQLLADLINPCADLFQLDDRVLLTRLQAALDTSVKTQVLADNDLQLLEKRMPKPTPANYGTYESVF